MDKLYCKLDVGYVEDEFDELDKYCKLDGLAKLSMSSMSWISCTVISNSWLSWNVSSMSLIS